MNTRKRRILVTRLRGDDNTKNKKKRSLSLSLSLSLCGRRETNRRGEEERGDGGHERGGPRGGVRRGVPATPRWSVRVYRVPGTEYRVPSTRYRVLGSQAGRRPVERRERAAKERTTSERNEP